MSVEMENARKLVALENRARQAAEELGNVSMELRRLDKEIVLSGWDWKRAGHVTDLMPQGSVSVNIKNISDRP